MPPALRAGTGSPTGQGVRARGHPEEAVCGAEVGGRLASQPCGPGPRCSRPPPPQEGSTFTPVVLLHAAGSEQWGSSCPNIDARHFHTKQYSPRLKSPEPDAHGFDSWFHDLFAL